MVDHVVKETRSILNVMKVADPWFRCRYTLNPYNGCEHACIYCDARSARYHLQDDFDETIVVKKDPHVALDRILSRGKGMQRDVVAFGGACDAYQPAETRHRNSRRLLAVLARRRFPVFLLTKSPLVLQDLDVLAAHAASTSWTTVAFTITMLDDDVARIVEPGAPPPSARMTALREVVRAKVPGMQAGTVVMPFLPFLGDPGATIEAIVSATRDAGGDFVLFSPGVSVRDRQGEHFLDALHATMPDVHELLVSRYLGDATWRNAWITGMNERFLAACKSTGMACRVPPFIPRDERKWNYIAGARLLDLAYVTRVSGKKWDDYQEAGEHVSRLGVSIAGPARAAVLAAMPGATPRVLALIDGLVPRLATGLDRFS